MFDWSDVEFTDSLDPPDVNHVSHGGCHDMLESGDMLEKQGNCNLFDQTHELVSRFSLVTQLLGGELSFFHKGVDYALCFRRGGLDRETHQVFGIWDCDQLRLVTFANLVSNVSRMT